MRQMAQVEHVAEHARDKEEGRFWPALAAMHRHQMGEAAGGLRLGRGALARLLRADARLDQARAGADGGGLEQDRDREIDAIGLADHAEEPHGDQRMPPKVEEAVLDADRVEAEKVGPETREPGLDLALGGDVIAVEIGPLESLTAL